MFSSRRRLASRFALRVPDKEEFFSSKYPISLEFALQTFSAEVLLSLENLLLFLPSTLIF